MANTLQGHRTEIPNWYDDPLSDGPMTEVNNNIGALRRAAYGYTDQQHFILQLFALHECQSQIPCLNAWKTLGTRFDMEPPFVRPLPRV